MIKFIKELESHLVKEIQGQCASQAYVELDGTANSSVAAMLCCKALGIRRVNALRFNNNRDILKISLALGVKDTPLSVDKIVSELSQGVASNDSQNLAAYVTAKNALLDSAVNGCKPGATLIGIENRSNLSAAKRGRRFSADLYPLGDLFDSEVEDLLKYYEETKAIPSISFRSNDGDTARNTQPTVDAQVANLATLGHIIKARGFCEA